MPTSSPYAAAIVRRTASPFSDLDADYLPRPFRPRDLAARVRVAELRRFNATGRRRYYRRGSFVIDLFDRKVAMEGEPIALAPSELGVLIHLASSAGHVATFGRILAGLGRAEFDKRAASSARVRLSACDAGSNATRGARIFC